MQCVTRTLMTRRSMRVDADDAELITVYYGEDTKAEDAEKLEQALTEKYPSCDVEVYAGGQPIYYYVVSVE